MSTVKTNNVQVGQSGTATQNFTLYQPSTPDGTVRLAVGNAGATSLDVLTANSSGNVGIGTSSPGAPLDVARGSGVAAYTSYRGNGNASASEFFVGQGGNNYGYIYNRANGPIEFATNNITRALIDSSGNLLVGTTSALVSSAGRGNITVNGSSDSIVAFGSAGANTGYLYATTSGMELASIGSTYVRFSTNGSERARIDSSGNLIVATGGSSITAGGGTPRFSMNYSSNSGAGYTIQDVNPQNGNTFIRFVNAGTVAGQITTNGSTTTSYSSASDYRLKENVQPMVGALAKVAQLKPCIYKWKADGSAGQGFIAHELQAVVPDCVTGEKDAVDADGNPVYQGIDTSFLVATLTAAIQEQQQMIEELKAEVAALKGAK